MLTVRCPACGEICELRPLKRAGRYQMCEPGQRWLHTDFCEALEATPRSGGAAVRRKQPLAQSGLPLALHRAIIAEQTAAERRWAS